MIDKILHQWLKIPYTLHVRHLRRVKKPVARLLFIHGIGSSGNSWSKVIDKLPNDVSVMTVDLLGFGRSPGPEWAEYDVSTQARSIITTLIKLRLTKRVVIVGHSLGSLVAIEVAKRYPLIVKSLVLCSPPLYDPGTDKNRLLKRVFKAANERPDDFIRLAGLAVKYRLVNPTINVTEENFSSYMATLRASILNQTSIRDIENLDMPITILSGTADPWVKKSNLKMVSANNSNIDLVSAMAGHEIRGRYTRVVVDTIIRHVSKQ